MLAPLGLTPSFGFGDRLGLATPGHIAAVTGTKLAPIFAQQSVRENARTGRTPQQVIDDARRAVEAAGWTGAWGADADHLKTVDDLPPFVAAGYTFYTIDPGAQVDNSADAAAVPLLQVKIKDRANWDELGAVYLQKTAIPGLPAFEVETLLRAVVKYGPAIDHAVTMYRRLSELMQAFDFEVSVDETDSPTTALEHYFIANELRRRGVNFTSLAPRFIGRFEKGVDYIGDLDALDVEMAKHAAVTAHFGTYKLSLHSGSDKFSVYPLIRKHWGDRIHVKTAGTSYLEALRTLAVAEPALFGQIWALALERYPLDRASYHVSAQIDKVPPDTAGPSLLDDFYSREILHVTFGSVLAQYGAQIKGALVKHMGAYDANLRQHFQRHLKLLE